MSFTNAVISAYKMRKSVGKTFYSHEILNFDLFYSFIFGSGMMLRAVFMLGRCISFATAIVCDVLNVSILCWRSVNIECVYLIVSTSTFLTLSKKTISPNNICTE